MKCFKIFIVLIFFFCIFSISQIANAGEKAVDSFFKSIKVNEIEKGILKDNLPQEVYEVPEKPHYLLGVKQFPDPCYERILEIQKLFQMKDSMYSTNGGLFIDRSVEKLGLHKNENYLQLISEIEVAGKKVFVIFPLHLLSDPVKKEFIFMSPLGPKNLAEFSPLYRKYEIQWGLGKISEEKFTAIKRALGWAQFQAVKNHLFGSIEQALEWNVKKHSGLLEKVLSIQQGLLDDPMIKNRLSESIPGLDNFKTRDILMTPSVEVNDFVPDILVFGPLKGAAGIANLKVVGCERIVFYDILGAAYDYIKGNALILAHEFVHTNPYLQASPIDFYFHVEMWTSLTTDLTDEFNLLLSHPYLKVVADTIHTFFGYNVKEARKRIWPTKFVSLADFNRKEFEKNIEMIKKINLSLNEFVAEVFFPNFYSDTYFWNSVNMKWCDTSAAWRIMMSFYFEPAIIFDPKKTDTEGNVISSVEQTKQWIEEQQASGKIKKLAEETMKRTGTSSTKEENKDDQFKEFERCPVESGAFHMSPTEKNYFKSMLEQMMKENDPGFLRAIWNLMKTTTK